jgi:isoquinoline 1-oxidoreductase beta subunit
LPSATGEAVRIEYGRCGNPSFDGYEVLRMGEHPAAEAHVIESGEAMGGVGEPPSPPTRRRWPTRFRP